MGDNGRLEFQNACFALENLIFQKNVKSYGELFKHVQFNTRLIVPLRVYSHHYELLCQMVKEASA